MSFLDRKQTVMCLVMIIGAGISTVLLIITISSDHLASCIERYIGDVNDIPLLQKNLSRAVVPYVTTNFGFWRACRQYTDENYMTITWRLDIKCRPQSWKSSGGGHGDNKGTEKITSEIFDHPMMKLVFVFTFLGLGMELAGHLSCLIDKKCSKGNGFMFVTGVWYVLAGMSILAGIVIFMGLVTEESLHQKELPKDQTPLFRYQYNTSFVMLAISFCLIEKSGILAVYLFINRYKLAYKQQHAKLHVLKSSSELLNEFINQKRNRSVSTESSHRPSYQPVANGNSNSHYNNCESSTRHVVVAETHPGKDNQESRSRGWLSPSRKPFTSYEPDYKELSNSESASSRLCGLHDNSNGMGNLEIIPPPLIFTTSSSAAPLRNKSHTTTV